MPIILIIGIILYVSIAVKKGRAAANRAANIVFGLILFLVVAYLAIGLLGFGKGGRYGL